jgi:peptide/nickel transport system substrate-binding protein
MIQRRRRAVVRLAGATVLLSALVLGAAAHPGPGHVQAAIPRSTANTLTIGWAYDAPSLDPAPGSNNSGIWAMVNIYDTLIRTGNDGASLIPDLATSWNISNGGTVYTFHLRHGVLFHNGQKLTAADVKFCLDRARNRANFVSWTLLAIKNVAAPDPSTVVVTLLHPWAPFLSDVALYNTGIYPMAYFQKVGPSYMSSHPVGTGPYMLEAWQRGRYLRLKRNPHYWMASQYLMQHVEFDAIPDDTTRLLKVEAGALDVDNVLPPSQVSALERSPSVKVVIDPSTEIEYYTFNTRFAPFNEVNVRQAINHAIDRAALIKTVLHGLGTPANSFIPKGAIDYDAALPVPAHDLSLARRLLSMSSVPHGFTLSVDVLPGNNEWEETARVLQSELAPLGIKVTIKMAVPNTWPPGGNHPYFGEGGWTNDIPDPDEIVTFAAGNVTGNFNSYYNDPAAAALSRQAAQVNDPATRKRLYYQIQQIWAREVWFIALYYVPFVNAVNSHVQGFHENPLGFFVLQGVHKL